MRASSPTVRPELVEGLFFLIPAIAEEGQGFDKLGPNGVEILSPNGIFQ